MYIHTCGMLQSFIIVVSLSPPAGYQGDGVTCRYVGICRVDNGGCHPLASCSESPGGCLDPVNKSRGCFVTSYLDDKLLVIL